MTIRHGGAVAGVELVGMPGCGKSTLYPRVLTAARSQGLVIAEPASLARDKAEAYFSENLPGFVRVSTPHLDRVVDRSVEAGHGPREKIARRARRLWFGRAYAAYRAREGDAPVFFEESMVHELWRLAYLLGDDSDVRRALRDLWPWVIPSRTIIQIKVSPATRHRRMRGKASLGPINRELAAHEAGSVVWRRAERTYSRLVRRATWTRTATLVKVDNENDAAQDQTVQRIVDVLAESVDRT